MKYTETGPQESLLSRDQYSTSNAGASMISRKDRAARRTRPIETEQAKKKPTGDYLKKLEESNQAVQEAPIDDQQSNQSLNRKKPS